jgi:hypothetical protein
VSVSGAAGGVGHAVLRTVATYAYAVTRGPDQNGSRPSMVMTAVTMIPERRLSRKASSGELGSAMRCRRYPPDTMTVAARYKKMTGTRARIDMSSD